MKSVPSVVPILPPSDLTPGIAPISVDYDWAMRQINRLQTKLDDLKPCVVRVGGLFNLYQNGGVTVQVMDAQMMWDYLDSNFPKGTVIRWFVLPRQPPLNAS